MAIIQSNVVNTALGWLQFAGIIFVGIVSYFLKQRFSDQDELEKTVNKLDKRIAILLDRDRRKRLTDYREEEEGDVEHD